MRRRTFLGGVVGAATLGASVSRTEVGDPYQTTEPLPVAVNTSGFEVEFNSVAADSISLQVFQNGRLEGPRQLVAFRQEFPGGKIYETAVGDVLSPGFFSGEELTFDFSSSGPANVPWQYSLFTVKPGASTAWDTFEYVGETTPVRGEKRLRAVDLTAPTERFGSNQHLREDTGGMLQIDYRWSGYGYMIDDDVMSWSARVTFGKSLYETEVNDGGRLDTYYDTVRNEAVFKVLSLLLNAESKLRDTRVSDQTEKRQLMSLVGFVQSIDYTLDSVSKNQRDHYRHGVETLVDLTADCEDTSFLLASFLRNDPFNYRVALLRPPGHLLPAVHEDDLPHHEGHMTTVELGGEPFVPIETTRYTDIGYHTKSPDTIAYWNNRLYFP
jgi:hypothetical protein